MRFGRNKTLIDLVTCPVCGHEVPAIAQACRYCSTNFERFARVRAIENFRQTEVPYGMPTVPNLLTDCDESFRDTALLDALERLAKLRGEGLIDDDEFKAAKAKLLNS